jgi:hypothetical protein
MCPVVGTLTVDLVANTATFTADLGKAGNSLDELGRKAKTAGKDLDFSMMEARGGMALMGEELGVHIPRHLQTLIAGIPGVGTAFATLLPIIGAVFAVELIHKWIEEGHKAGRALDEGFGKSLETIITRSDELQVSIEKSKMLIDKLEGKTDSGAALAIAEAKVEADKLAASLDKDIDGLIKLMETAAHGKIMTGLLGTSGAGQAEDVAKGFKDAFAQIPRDAKNYNELGAQAAVDAWKRAKSEIDKNNAEDAKQKARGKSDMGNLLGGTNFTKANQDLQKLQDYLSGVHDDLDLIGKSDALKVTVKGLEAATAAGKKEAQERKEAIDEFQTAAKKRVEYEKMMEAATWKYVDAVKKEGEESQKQINAVLMSKQKEADEWIKLTEKMIQEDGRHAAVMAELTAKDGGASAKGEEKRYQALIAAFEKERTLLTSTGERRIADEQKIDHKEEEEEAKHQNKMHELTRKGEQQRADLVKQFGVMTMFTNQSVASALEQIGKKQLASLVDNTLQALMVKEDAAAREKLIDAKSSAVSAFKWAMEGLPFPVNAVLAPIAAGAAFAGVMAFEQGGSIPGHGPVPIVGHGGETVVTKALTDRVEASEGRGKRGTGNHFHISGVKDADGFKASQTQIITKQQQAQDVAARRNGRR